MRKELSPLLAIFGCLLLAGLGASPAAAEQSSGVKPSTGAAPALRVVSAVPSTSAVGNHPITVKV